jgi:hypothetical protein
MRATPYVRRMRAAMYGPMNDAMYGPMYGAMYDAALRPARI